MIDMLISVNLFWRHEKRPEKQLSLKLQNFKKAGPDMALPFFMAS
jgi:hypothetical protein